MSIAELRDGLLRLLDKYTIAIGVVCATAVLFFPSLGFQSAAWLIGGALVVRFLLRLRHLSELFGQVETAFVVTVLSLLGAAKFNQDLATQTARSEADRDSAAVAQRAKERAEKDSALVVAIRVALQQNYNAVEENNGVVRADLALVAGNRITIPPLRPVDDSWWQLLIVGQPQQLFGDPETLTRLRNVETLSSYYSQLAKSRDDFLIVNGVNLMAQSNAKSFNTRVSIYDADLYDKGTRLLNEMQAYAKLHGWTFAATATGQPAKSTK